MEIPLMFPHDSGPLQWARNCYLKRSVAGPGWVFLYAGHQKKIVISFFFLYFFAQPPSLEWGPGSFLTCRKRWTKQN